MNEPSHAARTDRTLWARTCACLAEVDGVKPHEAFFGGFGATINANFVVGVFDNALVVHVGRLTDSDVALGATAMTIEGEECPGWVRVPAASPISDSALAAWVARGVAQAQSLSMFDRSRWPARVSFGYAPRAGAVAVGLSEEEAPAVTAAREASVRLSPEYNAELPLWGRGLDRIDVDELDGSLLDALREWQADFDREFHYQYGWSNDLSRWRWADAAIELEKRLRAALPPWVDLEVDLWPLDR